MRRFIAMHGTEAGFDSPAAVIGWIAATQGQDAGEWRVVEILVDPVTETFGNGELARALNGMVCAACGGQCMGGWYWKRHEHCVCSRCAAEDSTSAIWLVAFGYTLRGKNGKHLRMEAGRRQRVLGNRVRRKV